jgi:hypothetical protein
MKVKVKEKSLIAKLAAWYMGSRNIAIVFGKTIHLHGVNKEEFLSVEQWVNHELVHVRQFQRYGFFTFLIIYAIESMRKGYYNNRFEVEARIGETTGEKITIH